MLSDGVILSFAGFVIHTA